MSRIRRLVAPPTAEFFPRWIAGLAAVTFALTIGGGAGLAGATAAIQEPVAQREPGAAPRIARHQAQSPSDSLVAHIRSLRSTDARKEAVEQLGKRGGPEVLAALIEIARSDPNEDVQQEALETLGELRDPRALEQVKRLALTHPSADVRRKAIDNYAEAIAADAALSFLRDVLANDRSAEMQAEALEELAELPGGAGIPALIDAAGTHPSPHVRAEAQRRLNDGRERARRRS